MSSRLWVASASVSSCPWALTASVSSRLVSVSSRPWPLIASMSSRLWVASASVSSCPCALTASVSSLLVSVSSRPWPLICSASRFSPASIRFSISWRSLRLSAFSARYTPRADTTTATIVQKSPLVKSSILPSFLLGRGLSGGVGAGSGVTLLRNLHRDGPGRTPSGRRPEIWDRNLDWETRFRAGCAKAATGIVPSDATRDRLRPGSPRAPGRGRRARSLLDRFRRRYPWWP